MKIEKMKVKDLIPYENNAKLHPKEQIEQIVKSIKEFGFNDPIAIDENNVIIEGHGRLLAIKQMKYKECEVIKLTHLTEQQKKAYILAHNKLTLNSDFDLEMLEIELCDIDEIDMTDFGFDLDFDNIVEPLDEIYTMKVDAPIYEPKEEFSPKIKELFEPKKTDELLDKIKSSEIPEEIKFFLSVCAQRHIVFNYSKIAEFYCHADKEVQELMEDSALVIIDFEKAIENGYVKLSEEMKGQYISENK